MASSLIALVVILITHTGVHAFELPKACVDLKKGTSSNQCGSCTEAAALRSTLPKSITSDLADAFKETTFLTDRSSKLSKANDFLKSSLVPLYRTLQNGMKEPTYKESMKEIYSIKDDFDHLTLLSKESAIVTKKFNLCLFQCSAMKKLDLQDRLVAIQKAKVALFIKRPILANKVFEDKMLSIDDKFMESDKFFANSEFEETLMDALLRTLTEITAKQNDLVAFGNEAGLMLTNASNLSPVSDQYVKTMVKKEPDVVESIIRMAEFDGTFKSPKETKQLCLYAEKLLEYRKKEAIKKTAIDVSLFVVPLLLSGPLAPELMATRLALWGVKAGDAANAIRVSTTIAIQATVMGKDLTDLNKLSSRCSFLETEFYGRADFEKFSRLSECRKDFGEQLFVTQFGFFVSGTLNFGIQAQKIITASRAKALPLSVPKSVKDANEVAGYIKLHGLNELNPGQVGLEFRTSEQGIFSVLDLEEAIRSTNLKIKNLPEEYWRYVADIYSKRLKGLDASEIEDFIESSVQMSHRTKLIVNTEESIANGTPKFKGGIGIVDSTSSKELLPLEKATGMRIDRKPDEKIAEIVRLTVGKEGNAVELSSGLVSQAIELIVNDKSIKRVFIFTSRAHAKLYQTFGVPADSIKSISKRDVLIEMPREVLERASIKSKGKVVESSSANAVKLAVAI